MYHTPPEAPEMDVTVTVHGYTRGTLKQITDNIGGTANWVAGGIEEDGYREFTADTLAEDSESYEAAEDIITNLLHQHQSDSIDLDNLIVEAQVVEDDSEDWDRDHDW